MELCLKISTDQKRMIKQGALTNGGEIDNLGLEPGDLNLKEG
jgi:hypothetical protein